MNTATFTPAAITARVTAAIQPQLDALDMLIDSYNPAPRVIGKHHPEYDTVSGRLSYINRKLKQLFGQAAALSGPGVSNRLRVKCPTPGCGYSDAGFDHDLIMSDYLKHRAECNNS